MATSEVIYLPPTESAGEALGKGLGAAAISGIQAFEQRRFMQTIQAAEQAINNAPDRATALEINNKIPYQNIDQQQKSLQYINERFPTALEQPEKVPTYNKVTGTEDFTYVKKKDIPKFSPAPDQTLTKPVTHEYYRVNPQDQTAVTPVGTFAEGQQPTGTVSKDQVDILSSMIKVGAEKKSADTEAKKFQHQLEVDARQKSAEQLTQMKAYNGVVSGLLNLKKSIGANGEIVIDWSSDASGKTAKAYTEALKNAEDYITQFHGDVNKAAVQALKDAGYYDKPTEEPAAPQPPPKKSAWDFVAEQYGKMNAARTGQTTAAPEAKPSNLVPGIKSSAKQEAPQAAIDYLKSHNDAATKKAFQDKYGYLP